MEEELIKLEEKQGNFEDNASEKASVSICYKRTRWHPDHDAHAKGPLVTGDCAGTRSSLRNSRTAGLPLHGDHRPHRLQVQLQLPAWPKLTLTCPQIQDISVAAWDFLPKCVSLPNETPICTCSYSSVDKPLYHMLLHRLLGAVV